MERQKIRMSIYRIWQEILWVPRKVRQCNLLPRISPPSLLSLITIPRPFLISYHVLLPHFIIYYHIMLYLSTTLSVVDTIHHVIELYYLNPLVVLSAVICCFYRYSYHCLSKSLSFVIANHHVNELFYPLPDGKQIPRKAYPVGETLA